MTGPVSEAQELLSSPYSGRYVKSPLFGLVLLKEVSWFLQAIHAVLPHDRGSNHHTSGPAPMRLYDKIASHAPRHSSRISGCHDLTCRQFC